MPPFQTSDRCFACHNGLTTPSGEDVSIGLEWRASMMANSARDPYWQASVRRESLDHPASQVQIEDECATCHMPMARAHARSQGRPGQVFVHLGGPTAEPAHREALDGVSCSLCHQISAEKLGEPATFNGGFIIASTPREAPRPEFGPFDIDSGLQRVMRSSSGGFAPTRSDHIRESALCASCHTLDTNALGADGRILGTLQEQQPYQEWLHSSYVNQRSCQSCHMPAVGQPVAISRVLGEPRDGVARHRFVAANFFIQRMLNRYRDELSVAAQPAELAAAAEHTINFLGTQAARLSIEQPTLRGSRLELRVRAESLAGHRVPTAYPSRRAWLHVTLVDANRRVVFESGALRENGAIQGNDNDLDPARFEPHYRQIRSADEVQIYESILQDSAGHVTTGLLSAVGYLKDNRLLPRGFDKTTALPRIAVQGDARSDPSFTDRGDLVEYLVDIAAARLPLEARVELLYQPIGYRWAHNLAPFDAPEPRRFLAWYESMQSATAVALADAQITIDAR